MNYIVITNDRDEAIAKIPLDGAISFGTPSCSDEADVEYDGCWLKEISTDMNGNTSFVVNLFVNQDVLENISSEALLNEIRDRVVY